MKYIYLLTLMFFFTACSKDGSEPNIVIEKPESKNQINKNNYFKKIEDNLQVKIACEGTSITYGQNTRDEDIIPAAPGYGSGYTRSKFQYPQILQEVLNEDGIKAQVINRAYPGDRTKEGLKRWADSTSADVVILEYATNDAKNYGNHADGIISTGPYEDNLIQLVERRLNQGSWVIICTPPNIKGDNSSLKPYILVIKKVAEKYDLPIFEIQNNIAAVGNIWSDNVHLNAAANKMWGEKISFLLKNN